MQYDAARICLDSDRSQGLTTSGCSKEELYDGSKGPGCFGAKNQRIRAIAASYGVDLCLMGRTGLSGNSHTLIALALQQRGPSAQSRVVEALFLSHCRGEENVTDDEWLVKVGTTHGGLQASDVRRPLRSEEAGEEIDNEAQAVGPQRDVRAVPCVIVQGKYPVGGYQEEAVLGKLFESIWANGGS
ncbi:putative dithiol-disulfide isomerase [Emericellopsis cladophorae]|uniref:Dithiol-disulfide isomerase n=1 Tax=Emericellopsis cladophorae TaxID=2686198 RepID=A0A9P9Y725_9HYPO|nr:putative dithiol-disulfide isomerase [Emericellopsis cladophorae]KAI6784488.1 putative dithiol-disulfide isomerase [Emericellopsis cladophorae]